MHDFWQQLGNLLLQHLAAESVGGGFLLFSAIGCLPEKRPRTLDDFYAYFRETLQTAIPAARRVVPIQPAGPAQPKE